MTPSLAENDVLIAVDLQNDFLPGGSLAVPEGDQTVPLTNRLAEKFAHVVLTQDWHPPDHISFASQHAGRAPFETIALDYGPQILWPDHCVQGSRGAALADRLDIPKAQLIIRKGGNRAIDSYSGFREADRRTATGLAGYLRERQAGRLYLTGLATDFCVAWTALDAAAAGFAVTVIEDATRPIDTEGSLARAWTEMTAAGVKRIASADIFSSV